MISVKVIDKTHQNDINIKNEPFPLFGLVLPSYHNGKWDYEIVRFAEENVTQTCFPDENYDYEELSKNSVFIGAYDGEQCIGLAIMQQAMFRYMYLYDLKVNMDYRGRHVGAMLIEKAKEIAQEHGYRGIYTQGQDNNPGACLFYLRNGFEIGGLDTNVYKGTSQENKKDILFYCDITA
ncbi:MAG: GNAT family N-acetyltransferase [Lachnospiraceae bacterium]|nr:GNAT family N-acetyltransferase [Lachnospiraceae bacterium]